ncbi:MAG: hypothetical protein JKY84_06125 [Emcibacteraceae bacterium]|nr:hypothetical protein [Emcibacteraceae bacterium]
MGSWNEILEEVNSHPSAFDDVRRKYLKELSEHTKRNTVAYYSGWLQPKPGAIYSINDDDKNGFMACFKGLVKEDGLDLILHSPGGNVAATESLIKYLREIFGSNIRTIVPQISMSGGTMLACTGTDIIMGKHSNLGPIDPQFGGIPARELINEFQRAQDEVNNNPKMANVWAPILAQYHPTLLQKAAHALAWSEEISESTLLEGMFMDDDEGARKSRSVAHFLLSDGHHAHDRHIERSILREEGLKIIDLEDDPELQDRVLSVHHAFMITFGSTSATKIVENQNGIALVRGQNIAPPVPTGAPPPSRKPQTPQDVAPSLWEKIKKAFKILVD